MKRALWRGLVPLLLASVACTVAATRDVESERAPAESAESTWTEVAPSPRVSSAAHPVVVVTFDGARWQDVFDPALTPHLHAVIADRGAALGAPEHGATIEASGPNFVSLPGYEEIFTGRRPEACSDNDCARAARSTLADEMAERGDKVAIFSSWDRIGRVATHAREGVFISAGLDAGDRGVDSYPGERGFRPDRMTASLALAFLETRRPDFLFIGLGETDEYGHKGDRTGVVGALRRGDAMVGDLFAVLDRMGERGAKTTVIVTSDHGRSRDGRTHGRASPESARVWLVAAGPMIRARGFVSAPVVRHLADIAPTVRTITGLAPDRSRGGGEALTELFSPPTIVAIPRHPIGGPKG